MFYPNFDISADVYTYDDQADKWNAEPSMPQPLQGQQCAVLPDNKVLVCGGANKVNC